MRIRSGLGAAVAALAVPALAVSATIALPKAVALAKLRGVNEVPSIITDGRDPRPAPAAGRDFSAVA